MRKIKNLIVRFVLWYVGVIVKLTYKIVGRDEKLRNEAVKVLSDMFDNKNSYIAPITKYNDIDESESIFRRHIMMSDWRNE